MGPRNSLILYEEEPSESIIKHVIEASRVRPLAISQMSQQSCTNEVTSTLSSSTVSRMNHHAAEVKALSRLQLNNSCNNIKRYYTAVKLNFLTSTYYTVWTITSLQQRNERRKILKERTAGLLMSNAFELTGNEVRRCRSDACNAF